MSAPQSLRRLFLAGSAMIAVIAITLAVGLVLLVSSVRRAFDVDLRELVIEQRAADEIVTSVYGQLLDAYRVLQDPSAQEMARFDSLGQIAHDRLRLYLFQPMALEARIQVEAIKELHQSLEVEAQAAVGLLRRGDTAAARRRVNEMAARAASVEAAMDQFVMLRERDRTEWFAARTALFTRWALILGGTVAGLGLFFILVLRGAKNELIAPLVQFSDAATRVGTGDLAARVPPQRYRELATVAGRFNDMAARIRDTTEELQASSAQYRRLFEEAPVALYRTSPEGVLLAANPAFADLLGFASPDDVIGARVEPWYAHRSDREEFLAAIRSTGVMRDQLIELRRTDGRTIWALDTTRRVTDPATGDVSYEGALVDITERRRAEEARRESEERFREMAEHIKEAFFVVDLKTFRTLYISPTWAEISGRPIEEGYDTAAWLGAIHADDRELMRASLARVGGGAPDVLVFRVVRPDGTVRWVRGRSFPVRDAQGDVYRMVGVSEDITDLRQAEDRLAQAQKLDAVGRLAGGVAHDFNNLLTVIITEAEMVQGALSPESEEAEWMGDIRRAADSAAALTRQLLAFSRQQIVEPVVFNLGDAIAETGKMLRRLIGEDVRLEIKLSQRPTVVRADRGQIEQVLTNLAVNARDAMPGGGTLSIETGVVTIAPADASTHPDLAPGEYVLWSVSDTGTGMPPEVAARAFEPFFTTKEQGKGTGLGLATSHGIVKQAGGNISIYSEPNVGTTFRIYLPAVRGGGAS